MSFSAIILAAGKGTRLKSDLPKPLHKVAGMPLLGWVTGALNSAGADSIFTVISPGSQQIESWLAGSPAIIQEPQNGTGHDLQIDLERQAEVAQTRWIDLARRGHRQSAVPRRSQTKQERRLMPPPPTFAIAPNALADHRRWED